MSNSNCKEEPTSNGPELMENQGSFHLSVNCLALAISAIHWGTWKCRLRPKELQTFLPKHCKLGTRVSLFALECFLIWLWSLFFHLNSSLFSAHLSFCLVLLICLPFSLCAWVPVLNRVHEFEALNTQSSSVQWLRRVRLFVTPTDCSTPGFPVHHQLPELAQTHVHWVSDAIQPSHPLSSPSPSAFNLSQHQGLFQWVSSLHQVAKVLEFQLQLQSFQSRTDFF